MRDNGRDRQAEKYLQTSRVFLRQAEEELAAGDLRQASEKAWGAAAQVVKAIAAQRGWEHYTHAHLFQHVDRFSIELGSAELGRLFRSANSLHVNFYEGDQTARAVRGGIEDVRLFVSELDAISAH